MTNMASSKRVRPRSPCRRVVYSLAQLDWQRKMVVDDESSKAVAATTAAPGQVAVQTEAMLVDQVGERSDF